MNPQPGDLCRLHKAPDGRILVEHVAPCCDGFPTGTVTEPGSLTPVERPFGR